MYAAFGLSALLNDDGLSTQIIGGDLLCAVVAKDRSTLSLQGFGSRSSEPSHYWIEVQGMLVDLGPMYLPYESSFPAAALPVLRWPVTSKLPDFINYRERVRFAHDMEIANLAVRQRNAEFVALCRNIQRSHSEAIDLGAWELSDFQSLNRAAAEGDSWAQAAIIFLRRSMKANFPAHL